MAQDELFPIDGNSDRNRLPLNEQEVLLSFDYADAWFEYRDTLADRPPAVQDEIEPFAWLNLKDRMAEIRKKRRQLKRNLNQGHVKLSES